MSYLDIFWLSGMLGLCIWPLAYAEGRGAGALELGGAQHGVEGPDTIRHVVAAPLA